MGDPVTTTIFAAATVGGLSEQRKAAKEQRRANRLQERAAAIQNARERRRGRAEAIRAQAAIQAQGVAQGTAEASTTAGTASSLQSQLATNLNFQQQLEGLDRARFSALRKANRAQSNAATLGALASFAFQNRTGGPKPTGGSGLGSSSFAATPGISVRSPVSSGFSNPSGFSTGINTSFNRR